MIDPALAERLSAELRRRDASRREALTRLHETFADELGPLPDEPPVELGELWGIPIAASRPDWSHCGADRGRVNSPHRPPKERLHPFGRTAPGTLSAMRYVPPRCASAGPTNGLL